MNLSDAFNRDNHLFDKFKQLITDNDIDTVIETGTYHGVSTNAFASMGVKVETIESQVNYFTLAQQSLIKLPNVMQHLGDSPKVLRSILPKFKDNKVLIFLDAHWNGTPLIEELEEIAASGLKPIIAIHDFKVPNKDFGFDSYNGQDYTWEWIEPHVRAIYGNDFTHYYNTVAAGARRGVIFIEPKTK